MDLVRHPNTILAAAVILCGLLGHTKAESRDGGLIPVRPGSERGELADYRRLYESKLLVSPAEVACYVFLPASKRLEHVAAVYRAPQKKGSLPGGYWVTATVPSGSLYGCLFVSEIDGEVKTDPQTVTVRRFDAPIRESTAVVLHDAWVRMLRAARPRDPGILLVDADTHIFSAEENGRILRAESYVVDSNVATLVSLGELLVDYARAPKSKRQEVSREIESTTHGLLNRLHKPKRGSTKKAQKGSVS